MNFVHPIPPGIRFISLLLGMLLLLSPPHAAGADNVVPLRPCPAEQAAAFLSIPYRADGALDENGRYTLFAAPEKIFDTPGLNCSGLVVAAAREVLHRPLPLTNLLRDRNGDSGPDAPLRQDWDFGFDLLLNITEGLDRSVLSPEGRSDIPATANGSNLRGFPLDNADAWKNLLPLLRTDHIYLLSFSRERRSGLLHHHVALLLADPHGQVWFQQATKKSGVARTDLATQGGIERFLTQQRKWPGTDAHVLIIEAAPASPRDARPVENSL